MSQALVVLVKVSRLGSQVNPGPFKAETRNERTTVRKSLMPRFQEKPLSFRLYRIVPQTDTGGQVENTKAVSYTHLTLPTKRIV